MKKPRTKKQKALLKNLANGDTMRQAAINAGYSPNSANHSAKETTENYREYVEKTLKEKGVTFEEIVERLKECLTAKKVVGYLNSRVQGVEKISDEFVEVPDYQVRIKAIDISLKLYNAYPATKVELTTPVRILIDE